MKEKLQQIEREIELLRTEPILTNHACQRYLERVRGFSPEDIKQVFSQEEKLELYETILDKKTQHIIRTIRDGKIKKDGYNMRIKDYTVLTILKE